MTAGGMPVLERLTPPAYAGWRVLFELAETDPDNWCLLGGQMMYLLAVEAGRALPRPTADIDVVVNVRTRPGATEWLASWLDDRGFELDGISPDGIGHRFVKDASPGPESVVFDILAPEGLGRRTNLFTARPARTVQAPGTSQALARAELVAVAITDMTGNGRTVGKVRRPPVLAALICKAAATMIAARTNPERDWQDAALALSILDNPREARRSCDSKDLARLELLRRLLDPADRSWRLLSTEDRDLGVAALEFLIGH